MRSTIVTQQPGNATVVSGNGSGTNSSMITRCVNDVKRMANWSLPMKFTTSIRCPEVGRTIQATSWPCVPPATLKSPHAKVVVGQRGAATEVRCQIDSEPIGGSFLCKQLTV